MAVRIRDVALAAGVSSGAVSRALKGQSGLKEETRSHIVATARRLGYDFARLRDRPVQHVLFLLHRQHNSALALPFYTPVLLGAEAACREQGIVLSFMALGPADAAEEPIRRHGADAFLCAGFLEPERLRLLADTGKPLALVDLWAPDIASVNPDNVRGGYLATRHLIEQGRRRIAFLASTLAHYSIRQREQGYRQALFEAQILSDPALAVVAPPLVDTEMALISAVEQLLALPARPDAIFAFNDAAAIIALRVCRQRGLRVPEEIAIVGFDDIEAAVHQQPALTTVAIDKETLGRSGIELLLDPSRSREQREAGVQLIVRASSVIAQG